ncbi:MAG: cupin domain-containing protein [Henriciella sp.]|jgi:mannose-6-phosphate isomerase-like protein (cupin superfamily)
MSKVNISEKLTKFDEAWSPKIVGDMNGMQVKLAKFRGDFDWHSHENEDEMFLVTQGTMRMVFRDRVETVEAGEFIIVPRGVEHRPGSVGEECHVMLLEPATTVNTGENDASDRTVTDLDRI